MKPTSIIFLILAGVLLLSGIVLCLVGNGIASSNDIPLINEFVDKNGNEITRDELAEYDITDFKINMEEMDVNIIGSSERSYIEFVNINPAVYEYSIKNGKMDINSISPFKISAFIKITENGSGFSGLRSYLHLNKYENKKACINIYITEDNAISSVKVTLKNGSVNIRDMTANCAYELNVSKGDVKIENTKTEESTAVKITKGELVCDVLASKEITADVKNGNATFYCDQKYSFDAQSETGNVYFGAENMGESVTENYPDIKKFEIIGQDEEGNDIEMPVDIKDITVKVSGGDVIVVDKTAE